MIFIIYCGVAEANHTIAVFNKTSTTFTKFNSEQNGICADGEAVQSNPPLPIRPYSQTQQPTQLTFPAQQACVLMLDPDQSISIAQNTDGTILMQCALTYHCKLVQNNLTIQ